MNENTEWREVEGYEGNYRVDEFGTILSMPAKYKKGGIIKTQVNRYGYKVASLCKNAKVKLITVHRIVAMAYLGKPELEASVVNHKDGNKLNNHYSNLEWCTIGHNTQHAYDNGLIKKRIGGNHQNSKATDEQRKEMIEMYEKGNMFLREIADMFNLKQPMVAYICREHKRKTRLMTEKTETA